MKRIPRIGEDTQAGRCPARPAPAWLRIFVFSASFASSCCLLPASVSAAEGGFENFITRSGNKLMDGGKEFRFIGANMPGLVVPYDFTMRLPERMGLATPWEQEDALKTLDQMNGRVVRTWNLPMRGPDEPPQPWHYVLGPGQFNEKAFVTIDHLLALANRHRIRVILCLSAEAGDYLGGIGTYAAHRGKKRAEFWTDPQLQEDYKATVRFVLGRTNTVSGVPYRDDKAILAWQFGNEMYSATTNWLSGMAAFMKGLDPNHLVAETRHRPGPAHLIDPNIDILTRHYYTSYGKVGDDWAAACRAEIESIKGQRPFFVGEFGPYVDGKGWTADGTPAKLRGFLDACIGMDGMAGAMLWSMYFHHERGGYYWHQIFTFPSVWSYHWPGFPSAHAQAEIGIMREMREAAFRIQGLPVPPVPIPEAPELLTFDGVPMFSWRGSAGASGYDIERAPAAAGPWTRLAENVSDADIAYRPLYSDTTVKAGQTWFYRVAARNASGVSKPSNVVGPVKVREVCLADELQDFSRASAKSDGLATANEYNAICAEYLFRAKGSTNDWIAYTVPAGIRRVELVAFFPGPIAGPMLRVSADGASFTHLAPTRIDRKLPPTPGGAAGKMQRTMATYRADVPPGQRHVRIDWTTAMELDRVEIRHPGGP
jgi:hypothetical protein